MKVSENMQSKLNKISELEKEGYSFAKVNRLGCIVLKDRNGRRKRIFGLPGKKSPVGFSWIAFFFAPFVYAQIKEWSFFYAICITNLATSVIEGAQMLSIWEPARALSIPLSIAYLGTLALSWGVVIYFCYSFPYHRKLKAKAKAAELNRISAIATGTLLSAIALFPSVAVTMLSKILQAAYLNSFLPY